MVRLRIVTVLIAGAFTLIWLRLFYWQVLSHELLSNLADNQHFFRLEIPPARGEIRSRDGTPLVANQTAYLVFAEKKYVDDIEEYSEKLAPILEEEEASISGLLNEHDVWVPIKHQVDEQTVDKIKELELAGLGFEREDKRFYPETSMAAHLLGFVGKDALGKPKGYFGLEGFYDKELAGQPGFLLQERDAYGNPIVIGKIDRIEPKHGRSLVLYLDKTVQFIAETKLKKALEKYGAKAGNVVILDPKTGGILASASYPNYDPLLFSEFPDEYYRNPIVADTYEPGSTFKPLVMAKAFELKKLKPTDTYDESGPVTVSGYQIKTWNSEYHGKISMSEILQYSSNVGMVYISSMLGKDGMLSLLSDLGLGSKTGIDLQEEAETFMRDESEWRDIDLATTSFGQGIAITPIQMIRAIAAIANNGVLMEPRLVKEIVSEDGKKIEIPPKETRRLYSAPTAKVIAELMVDAVEYGEAQWTVTKGFRIAGKTGTAQIPVEGHYDSDKTIASFVGFGPVENPRFVMLVTLREPTSSPWGSETAAPLFFDIANELFPYFGMYPQ
ncbi:MAG: peptidoglycan glycosyltransferase, cell division protein FtsI (penicillin-binding protein 3) [Microgenomates group bacterium GW2011_GWC1_41_8]|uniref:Peptidoglycan glycosyltransferase n=1 Tax=Candidatus Roizmanbacteria bacterium GW2011_GWB1_40_7 TaxID=1618482 RepID=A0A0G0WBK9_9BACT|nr:MAG: Peptidoglycan glycosyltransferase [Candidatus Levybacteria bacterium GW2011_GWA2_40_16]KKR72587.1 MAG: Peptidoglycan glycosyltransferase [Candidatus Roizmanbacteria bacterium GW2011_GWB1_40_7]KKS24782.1 MAG: peptidoglycan glycosyltransferase, cell division protein FtsI (penicillin-binding protein 3) [Microgenomates group bacterium GW2011_GWC1_41_8]